MRANPEPDDDTAVRNNSQNSIAEPDSYGINRPLRVNPFEGQDRVIGILSETLVGLLSELSDVIGKGPVCVPKIPCRVRVQSFSGSSGSVSPVR